MKARFDSIPERYYEEMIAIYEARLESDFDWEQLEIDALDCLETSEYSESVKIGRVYLGSSIALNPSGKYWTSWAMSNLGNIEVFKDSCAIAALENVAARYGGWIESGEGDPLDQFFCKSYED